MDELGTESLIFSLKHLSFHWRVLFSSAPTICFGNKRERTRDPVCWWLTHLPSHLHRHVGNHVCPSTPSTIKFTPSINHQTLITLWCLFQLNFGIGGDQTQHVLWRLANGELDNIKPKVNLMFLPFYFPPYLNKVFGWDLKKWMLKDLPVMLV